MKRHSKRAKLKIRRGGSETKVLRKTGGTKNGYGKIEGATWDHIATEYAVLNFSSGQNFQQNSTEGGTMDVAHSTFRIARDSVIQDGDRILQDGIEYEVQTIAPYPTHKTIKVVMVNA